ADHLSSWGYSQPTSPNLDILVSRGVRFSNFMSNSSWTRPGVASLLTGLYPRSTGIFEEQFDKLSPELLTLAERFSDQGYRTMGVTANPNTNSWFGFSQGFDVHSDSTVVWRWMPSMNKTAFSRQNDLDKAKMTTDRTLALIKEQQKDDRPFYLQVLYVDPHWPYQAPNAHASAVASPDAINTSYDGEIHYVDAQIGRLLNEMDEANYMDNTLVIVTSDHGEGLGDHQMVPFGEKHGDTLYDTVIHVPLIFSHPALPQGRVVDGLAGSVDLVPTLFDLLGWQAKDTAGFSAKPWVLGTDDPVQLPPMVISETDWRSTDKVSARSTSHRYIHNFDNQRFQRDGEFEGRTLPRKRRTFLNFPVDELYTVDSDGNNYPVNNLFSEESPLGGEYKALVEKWVSETPIRPPLGRSPKDVTTLGDGTVVTNPLAGGEIEMTIEMAEQLRALGYLDD
ncbi:MAG: sulfatase, partial [Proteobacteria bacterium]|nr:sulfatase [Pseudomonadota bacterium]